MMCSLTFRLYTGNYLHPLLGVVLPLLTFTHTHTHTHTNCAPPLGVCVYCSGVVFVHSVEFYALVSWAIPTYCLCQ